MTSTDACPTDLSPRPGPAPHTTGATPHMQLNQHAPQQLQDSLWAFMTALHGGRAGRSLVSEPRSKAILLESTLANGPRQAFLTGTEFVHLHGDGSGSLHLALPIDLAQRAIELGWAEQHPVVAMGMAPATLVMVFGPRDDHELAVVSQLVRAGHSYASGENEVR